MPWVSHIAAFGLGVVLWFLLRFLTPDASPLDSGPQLLGTLLVAGFLVALLHRDLGWGLLALFLGQVAACAVEQLPEAPARTGHPLFLQVLFLVSYNLVSAVGGMLGGFVAEWAGRKPVRPAL